MKAALESYMKELDAIREAGTWREERIITTPQRDVIDTTKKAHVVNMCACAMLPRISSFSRRRSNEIDAFAS